MTTGWPQNQPDLRWPYSDANDAGPDSQAGGRVATDSDRTDRSAADSGYWAEHPSGPLPVTPMPQPRGRLGRGKSRGGRDTLGVEETAGDADYDWIRYLGEAGPAQDNSKRPAEPRPSSAEQDSRSGRGPGRRSRRHAAPEQAEADTDASPTAVRRTAAHRGPVTQVNDFVAPERAMRDRMPERGAGAFGAGARRAGSRAAGAFAAGAFGAGAPSRPARRASARVVDVRPGEAGNFASPRPAAGRAPTANFAARHCATRHSVQHVGVAGQPGLARPSRAAPRTGHRRLVQATGNCRRPPGTQRQSFAAPASWRRCVAGRRGTGGSAVGVRSGT